MMPPSDRARFWMRWTQIATLMITATFLALIAMSVSTPNPRRLAVAFAVFFAMAVVWKLWRWRQEYPEWH